VELGRLIAKEFSTHYQKNISAVWAAIDLTGDFWSDISFALSGDFTVENKKPAFDVVLSSVTATTARGTGGRAVFTNSYVAQNYGVVLSAMGVKKGITMLNINSPGNKIAVGKGTTNEGYVKQTWPKATAILFGSFTNRTKALASGLTHAGVGDEAMMKAFAESSECEGCSYLDSVGDPSFYGMAVRPPRNPAVEDSSDGLCKIVVSDVSKGKKNCRKIPATRTCKACNSFADDRCDLMLNAGKSGKCCSMSFCCISQTCSRYRCTCKRNVKQQDVIECSQSGSVTITVSYTGDQSGITFNDTRFINVGTASKATKVQSLNPVNSMIPCVVDLVSKRIRWEELSASKRVNPSSVIFFFVWFLFRSLN